MRIKIIWGAIILILLLFNSLGVQADSLWGSTSKSPFVSAKSTNVGDLVTVLISVNTSAKQSGGTSTDKDSKVEAGLMDVWNQIAYAIAGDESLRRDRDYEVYGKDKFKGKGKTSHSSSVRAKMTTKITEVKPNGMLVISGKQSVKVNNETETILVTGLVRPDDITSENTVYSYLIADVDISVSSKGPIGSKQNPGILTRIFNWLF